MKTANDRVEQNESVSEEGVVDAAITIQLENCLRTIILEVKTQSESLDPDQLAKYQSKLDIPRENCYTLTWPQVYNAFRTELEELDPNAHPLTTYTMNSPISLFLRNLRAWSRRRRKVRESVFSSAESTM
jgi:hypothetical protein